MKTDLLKINISNTPTNNLEDFEAQVIINNHIGTVLVVTEAKVSACRVTQASKWVLTEEMQLIQHKIKPFNSLPVLTKRISQCTVTHGQSSIPTEWYITEGTCKPVLSGSVSKRFGIIHFANNKDQLQQILSKYPHNFEGPGKLKTHPVKLHIDTTIKPVMEPKRTVLYHLQQQVDKVREDMIKNDVVEEHPISETDPWISNMVVSPKPDDSLRMPLDARKVIQSSESQTRGYKSKTKKCTNILQVGLQISLLAA